MQQTTQQPPLQHIKWPWQDKGWTSATQKVCAKIHNLSELDIRLSARYLKMRPRSISGALDVYFSAENCIVTREVFIDEIVPMLQDLVKRAPVIFKNIRGDVLGPGVYYNYVYTREQAAAVSACMFFGMFNKLHLSEGPLTTADMQMPTFQSVFTTPNHFAIQCLMCYFRYLLDMLGRPEFTAGRIVLRRNAADPIDWSQCEAPLANVSFGTGPIDASAAPILTVFAANPIGGEMFVGTSTQEGITFLTRPDAILALLFTCKLGNDTVTVLGTERISTYHGYGCGVTFESAYTDETPVVAMSEKSTMRQSALIFMDASKKTTHRAQLADEFLRDLSKAYCGYTSIKIKNSTIAGGNWTYGHNSSNIQVKFIQQLLAASAAGHSLVYHPISEDFKDTVEVFLSRLEGKRVCDLYIEYCNAVGRIKRSSSAAVDIFEDISFEDMY